MNGIWLPDHEEHLLTYAHGEGWTYQAGKLWEALKYISKARTAIDVGGHCGLWSKELVKVFDKVIAFEPVAEHRDCFIRNVRGNYELYPVALGDKPALVSMHTTTGQSGDTWIDGEGDVPVTLLDEYALQDVDFIKLDCEGYEYFALKGGEETIKRCQPVIIVEQKPGRGAKFGLSDTAAVTYLEGLGYTLKKEIAGDYILCP